MENRPHTVTIGIPAYNAIKDLRICLDSIKKADDQSILETIVVDDGSTDETSKILTVEYPWVKVVRLDKNIGVSLATQYILDSMGGEYLVRLDADTALVSGELDKMVEIMENDPKIGVLAPGLIDFEGRFQPSVERRNKKAWNWFWDYFLWGKKLHDRLNKSNEIKKSEEIAYAASAALMVRKKTIDQVGGLDHEMEFFMEDADWLIRVAKQGWRLIYYPEIKVIHKGGQSGYLYIHTRDRSLKNLHYFHHKHLPGKQNQVALTSAVLLGSTLSLGLALLAYPIMQTKPNWREINRRGRLSFWNVLRWYSNKLFQKNS